MNTNLTVLILTRNAQATLETTLKSIEGLTNNAIVIDDYSTDSTKKIARNYGCWVLNHHFNNFGDQRVFALSQVKTEWTLVLDSDEVLTAQNKVEIATVIQNSDFDGYYLHFRNHLFGKKLNYGELHKKLVLFKTKKAHSISQEIHERYQVKGKTSELQSEVLHYSYRSISQIVRKFLWYSILQAKEYKKEKKRYGFRELMLNPIHMFYARFITDEGYRDGLNRIFLDYQFAQMEFLSYFLIPFVKATMRISVDCGPYAEGERVQSGIDRIIQGIHSQGLDSYDYYWFSFHPKSHYKLFNHLYAQFWLPLATLLKRCDVFLGTAGTIPFILRYFRIKKIVFIYDFGFFSSPDDYVSSAKRLQKQTEQSILYADSIVVFNEAIYEEFFIRYPQYGYKVSMIPAGADHLDKIEEEPVAIQSDTPFLLYVGVVKPVKRIDKILSVIGDAHCIIAGPQESHYVKNLHIGATQHVEFIKSLSDGQLKWLYKNAKVMIYTSKHEGFCYPVLEALSLGLTVVALDLPVLRTYQPYFPHLLLVKTDEELRKELKNSNKKVHFVQTIPYKWSVFAGHLTALWQPHRVPNKKVAFIGVLYKTQQEEVIRLENQIKKINLPSFAMYWIDNSSNGKGYAAGINEGIRRALLDNCDTFIALNMDISLQGITAEQIVKAMSEFDVWGFAMKQDTTLYYGGEIEKWRMSGGLLKNKPKYRYTEVDFVSGSVLGFSKEVVQTVGFWDESYFMYYEDVDYCVRARKNGFSVGIDSDTSFNHFEVSKSNRKKARWIGRSRWRFFWKYANLKQKMREVVRLPKTMLNQ